MPKGKKGPGDQMVDSARNELHSDDSSSNSPSRTFVRMSEKTCGVGIDKRNTDERPDYSVTFTPAGGCVFLPVGGGVYGRESEEPYICAENLRTGHRASLKLSTVIEAARMAGYTLELREDERGAPSPDGPYLLYEKSQTVGLDEFAQPHPGGGKICQNCSYATSGSCTKSDAIRIERYNDGLEYCFTEED